MKNRAMPLLPAVRRLIREWIHDGAWAGLLEPLDDHAIAGFQPLLNDPPIANALAHDHSALLHLVVRPHSEDGLQALHVLDGSLRDQQGAGPLAGGRADAAELPRQKRVPRIGEGGLEFQGPGLRIHLIDGILHAALEWVHGAVGQHQFERGLLQREVGRRAALELQILGLH